MRVRTFKPQFAPLVQSGVKRQTIRPIPKGRQPRPGDLESWREWTGRPYGSPQRELARVKIISIEHFKLDETPREILASFPDRPLKGALMPIAQWNAFAQADGFKSFSEMVLWFEKNHGLPFTGIVIKVEDV
jgi:hypothetical protein